MTRKKLSLLTFALLVLVSLVSAGSFVTIQPVNSLNLSQGYSVVLNITNLNGMRLNNSASFTVNVIGAASITTYTSTGTASYSGSASYVLTTQAANTVNISDVLGYNQTYLYNTTNVKVKISSPPRETVNATLNLSKCGTSNTFTQNSILVRAVAPPCANLNVSKQLAPNETFNYSNSTYGIALHLGVAPQNVHMVLGLNQSVSLPGNIVISAMSINDFVSNKSLQESVMSALANWNCTANGIAYYTDNTTHKVVSMCTNFVGLGYDIPAMIASQPISSNRTMSGYAQMCAEGFQSANATAKAEAQTANTYLNEYDKCVATNDPMNISSPANQLAYTRMEDSKAQPGLQILTYGLVVIILLGGGFIGYKNILAGKAQDQQQGRHS